MVPSRHVTVRRAGEATQKKLEKKSIYITAGSAAIPDVWHVPHTALGISLVGHPSQAWCIMV